MVTWKIPDWDSLKTTSQKQLELELSPLEEFFYNIMATTSNTTPVSDKVWLAAYGIALSQEARIELGNRRIQNAWALYYEAELVQYRLMDAPEYSARAGEILFERAELLDDGAKQNVRMLIGDNSGNGDWKVQNPLEQVNVVEARRIVQDYYNDKYTCLGLSLAQLTILATIAGLVVLIVTFTLTQVPNTISTTSWLFWFTIGLFGAIGGSVSALLGLQKAFALKNDMPERVLNKWVTIAKPVIGFAAAVIIAVFIIGGLVEVANVTLNSYTVFAMAFVSGFSERLIVGSVEARLPS